MNQIVLMKNKNRRYPDCGYLPSLTANYCGICGLNYNYIFDSLSRVIHLFLFLMFKPVLFAGVFPSNASCNLQNCSIYLCPLQ